MTKKKEIQTRVIFIIDGSGSMGPKATDVREGFNTYVQELRKDEKADILLSAAVFNTKVFPLFKNLPVSKAPKLGSSNYAPGGNTALYDAIGEMLPKGLGNKSTQYIVVIMTDGEENSSRIHGKHTIAKEIAQREEAGNWTFVYLGADQDSFGEARSVGIPISNTYGAYFAMDPLGGFSDLAMATTASHSTANMTGNTKSFAANLASTASATISRASKRIKYETHNPTKGTSDV